MSSISSFDIISVVDEGRCPDTKIFLCIPASAAVAAAVNLKGIKTLLANGLITFFINGNLKTLQFHFLLLTLIY